MARAVESFGAGAQWFADPPALAAAVAHALGGAGAEVRILIKGSRFNRLERVVGCAQRRQRRRGEPLMLYWLTQQLAGQVSGLHVFPYLTFRAILATLSALGLSLIVGPGMIARLSSYQIGQVVRDDGPQTHLLKAGTPTMGGALILVTTLVSTLLWADLDNRFVWMVLASRSPSG